jgi:hypothetical protein
MNTQVKKAKVNKVNTMPTQAKKAPNVINQIKAPKEVYIKEGLKGKDIIKLKLEANNAHKEEIHSLSFCINQFSKHGENLIKGFNNISILEITPKNILPFLSEKEKIRLEKNNNKFSFYLIESLAIRYIKAKFNK